MAYSRVKISYPHTKWNTSYRSLPIGQPRIIFRFTGPGSFLFFLWILITEIHAHWCYSCDILRLRLCFKYIKKFPCYDIISKGIWGSVVINLQPCNKNEYFLPRLFLSGSATITCVCLLPFETETKKRCTFWYMVMRLKCG